MSGGVRRQWRGDGGCPGWTGWVGTGEMEKETVRERPETWTADVRKDFARKVLCKAWFV